jgi:shikimate kinase
VGFWLRRKESIENQKARRKPGFFVSSITMMIMQNRDNNRGDENLSIAEMIEKTQSGNLVLVGMMGSGKTTIGRTLARHLNKCFIDSDEEIVKRTGVTIPHIFDVEGEEGFRQRESNVIKELIAGENIVLATGGGAVLEGMNRELLRANGIVIYLRANVHDLWMRTRHDRNRPLLQIGDPQEKLRELFRQRDPLYKSMSDIVMQSGKQSANSLTQHLVAEIVKYHANAGLRQE